MDRNRLCSASAWYPRSSPGESNMKAPSILSAAVPDPPRKTEPQEVGDFGHTRRVFDTKAIDQHIRPHAGFL